MTNNLAQPGLEDASASNQDALNVPAPERRRKREAEKRVAIYAQARAFGGQLHAPETIRSIFQLYTDGHRIVTAVSEPDFPKESDGFGGPVLRKLVKRMLSGEFEAIVASFTKSNGGIEPDEPFMLRIEAHNDSMTQTGAL